MRYCVVFCLLLAQASIIQSQYVPYTYYQQYGTYQQPYVQQHYHTPQCNQNIQQDQQTEPTETVSLADKLDFQNAEKPIEISVGDHVITVDRNTLCKAEKDVPCDGGIVLKIDGDSIVITSDRIDERGVNGNNQNLYVDEARLRTNIQENHKTEENNYTNKEKNTSNMIVKNVEPASKDDGNSEIKKMNENSSITRITSIKTVLTNTDSNVMKNNVTTNNEADLIEALSEEKNKEKNIGFNEDVDNVKQRSKGDEKSEINNTANENSLIITTKNIQTISNNTDSNMIKSNENSNSETKLKEETNNEKDENILIETNKNNVERENITSSADQNKGSITPQDSDTRNLKQISNLLEENRNAIKSSESITYSESKDSSQQLNSTDNLKTVTIQDIKETKLTNNTNLNEKKAQPEHD